MNFFKSSEILDKVERMVNLLGDKGYWIRVGTWTLGGVMIGVGVFLIAKRATTGIASSTVGEIVGDSLKGS